MKEEIYDAIVSKIATLEPWFARALVDGAIERAGKSSYEEISPVEMLHLIRADIEPRLASHLPDGQSILDAGAGVLVTDVDDQIVHVNPIMQRLLDSVRRASGIAGSDSALLCSLGLLRPLAEVSDVQVRKVHCDGIGRVINLSLSPVINRNGERTGLSCVYQDVTLHESIENSMEEFFGELQTSHVLLQQSEEKYKSIVENVDEVIMVTVRKTWSC